MFDYRTPQQKAKMRALNAAEKLGIVNIDTIFQVGEEDQAKIAGADNRQEFSVDIKSPVEGKLISLKDSGDRVFAMKALGEGAAIVPEAKQLNVVAPVDGSITSVAASKHAYTLMTEDGVGVLVHVGIDTVKLGGKGFNVLAEEGMDVKAGDILAKVDFAAIKDAGYKIPVVVTVVNTNEMKNVNPKNVGQDIKELDTIIEVRG